MKKSIFIRFVLPAVLLLAACSSRSVNYSIEENRYIPAEDVEIEVESVWYVTNQDNPALSWQEAYAALLRENHTQERFSDDGNLVDLDRFLLHDMDMDGIPELFVLSTIDGFEPYNIDRIVTVYTFREGAVMSLEYSDEDMWLAALFSGAARTRIGPAPENMPGFVFMGVGPSAGAFGVSTYHWRVVIEGDGLAIADYGEWSIDYEALHELFDDFGFNTDENIHEAAIMEHTHITINGNPVYEEALNRAFGGDRLVMREGEFQLFYVNEDNINDLIFSWEPKEIRVNN